MRPTRNSGLRHALPGSVLVTGASGYVGGRLVDALCERGVRVRCLVRDPQGLSDAARKHCDVVTGDVLDPGSLRPALRGVDVAYYLVHAMGADGDFEEAERRGARNFADAARAAGVRRLIYLGGLCTAEEPKSSHMRSRFAVGEELRESGVETIELRASIVIGCGSSSFDLMRTLTERLPVMVTPRWTAVATQPIGIDDLLSYLTEAMDLGGEGHRIYEIGGADSTTYAGLMREYARQRGLRRLILRVPVMTPGLSSRWLRLVAPRHARVGRRLIESTSQPSVVTRGEALADFDVVPRGVGASIRAALSEEERGMLRIPSSDADEGAAAPVTTDALNRYVDRRSLEVAASPRHVFDAVRRIGGRRGWYAHDWLWRLRGALDLIAGGVGLRRGRRHAVRLRPGDPIDCWRVDAVDAPRRLLFRAEMRLPGRAWLSFEVSPSESGATLHQTAVFAPSGLAGIAYWNAVKPLHALVFDGMLRGIASAAESDASGIYGPLGHTQTGPMNNTVASIAARTAANE